MWLQDFPLGLAAVACAADHLYIHDVRYRVHVRTNETLSQRDSQECLSEQMSCDCRSNVSTCTIMLPVLAIIAKNMGIHPYLLLIPGTISTSFAFMLPIATPPNAIAFSGGDLVVLRISI